MRALYKDSGCVVAYCPNCTGARSVFEWKTVAKEFGVISHTYRPHRQAEYRIDYRLFRCAGCGRGALGVIKWYGSEYPGRNAEVFDFYPLAVDRVFVPRIVPFGIRKEFEEAEKSFNNKCFRAAAGLFRSVLDKTMRANGYNTRKDRNLFAQIEAAADDGVITEARKKKAHDEVRVLGNDVLHDEWCEIPEEDVSASRHYTQRILEDFYDDRETVLKLLRSKGRTPSEDQPEAEEDTS